MTSIRILSLLAATALVIGFGLRIAVGHEGATGIVKERMNAMKSMAAAMKAIGGMLKGKEGYDAEKIRPHARAIVTRSGSTLTKLYPLGSLEHPSEARKEIWEQWPVFEKLASDLRAYAQALEQAGEHSRRPHATMMTEQEMINRQGPDLAVINPTPEHLAEMSPRSAFRQVAETCKSCHERFRQKKQ